MKLVFKGRSILNPAGLGLTLLLALGLAGWAEAGDNSTYLDQSGASSTVTIVQTGTANAIGSSDTDFIAEGSNQVLSITQEGTTNSLTGSTLGADSTAYSVSMVGADNTVSLDHGTIGAISNSELSLSIAGSSNQVDMVQGKVTASTYADQVIVIDGDSNIFTAKLNANNVTNRISIGGDLNAVSLNQEGSDYRYLKLDMTNSYRNVIEINQQGTETLSSASSYNKIDVNITGSDHNITITQ